MHLKTALRVVTAHVVCGAGSMHLSDVCLFVCLSQHGPQQQSLLLFQAGINWEGFGSRRYWSTAAWHTATRQANVGSAVLSAFAIMAEHGLFWYRKLTTLHTPTITTTLHTLNGPLSGTTPVSRLNQSGFYWSKRQWVAVASTGPHASLHLTPDR